MIKQAFLAALAAAGMASTANAATIFFNPNVFGTPATFTLFSDFDTAPAQAVVVSSGPANTVQFVTGDLAGAYLAVPGNATPYLAVRNNGIASIDFGTAVRSFSFDYSSVDTFNQLTIRYVGGTTEFVNGQDILDIGNNGPANGSVFGSFIINGDGTLIEGLTLASTGDSFEVDNLSIRASLANVPEPATWAFMVLGFGIIGAGMRRKAAVAA